MVVSDLHGNWDDYVQVMRRWRKHQRSGEADHLVFLGDLVHARGKWTDASLAIIDDLRRRACNLSGSNVWCVMGNHEMVHIYHVELWKGEECFTAGMEVAMGNQRAAYIRWLMDMPFWVRTDGGVLLVHAGACREIGGRQVSEQVVKRRYLFNWPHRTLLRELARIAGVNPSGDLLTELNPAIGLAFDELPQTRFLWEFCMNKNEREYGEAYFTYLNNYLRYLSYGAPRRMQVVVSGHVRVPFGWEVVSDQHLRISSGFGAEDDSFKTYLLLDADRFYSDAHALENCTMDLYPKTGQQL